MTEETGSTVVKKRQGDPVVDLMAQREQDSREQAKTDRELKRALGPLFYWGRDMFYPGRSTRGFDRLAAPATGLETMYMVPDGPVTDGMMAKAKVELSRVLTGRAFAHGIAPDTKDLVVREGLPEDLGRGKLFSHDAADVGDWCWLLSPGTSALIQYINGWPRILAFYGFWCSGPVTGEVMLQVGAAGASTRAVLPLWTLGTVAPERRVAYFSRPIFYNPMEEVHFLLRVPGVEGQEPVPVEIGFCFLVCEPWGPTLSG